jgi:hypothetical protein
MDVWHFALLFNVFAIHIMLPFSRSDLNVLALGIGALRRTQEHVNEAYFISAFGYLGILLGGSLWRVQLGVGLRGLFSKVIEIPARASLFLLESRRLLLAHGIVALSLLIGLLAYYFSVAGFGLNFRGLLLVSPALRPIAQFGTFYAILIASYCFARFIRYRERPMMYITVSIGIALLFFGSRSPLLGIFILAIVVSFITMRRKLRISLLLLSIAAALGLAVLLDALRSPSFSLSAVAGGLILSIFYGNSFSDTRDFAVILSYWDGHYLLGKTYLAGLMAFVPRFLSSFRETWSVGVVTATMAGFSPLEHPGLRVGLFGEAFLNFGVIAVFAMGILMGTVTRLMDLRMKQSAASLPESGMRIYSYYIIATVLGAVTNSSNASSLYSIAFIFLASWAAVKTSRLLRLNLF